MEYPTQEFSHIDLVLSYLPMNVLHILQTSVTQKIQLCAKLNSMDLAKVNANNDALHAKYNKMMLEQDEAMQKTTRLQHELQEVHNKFIEVPMEVDTPLEY